jgi:hypothetical protein
MKLNNSTTVTAASMGGAIGVVAVWIQGLCGLDVPATVAAAEAMIFSGVLGLVWPVK